MGSDRARTRARARKKSLLVLCLVFASCTHHDPWSVKYIEEVARLCYHSHDKLGGIDIEILKTATQLTSYLQIRSGMIETEKVVLIAQETEYFYHLSRHRGGQRFNIPEEMQNLMITLLNEEIPFVIKIGGYKEKITPGSFKKKFQSSNYTIPFHLPF